MTRVMQTCAACVLAGGLFVSVVGAVGDAPLIKAVKASDIQAVRALVKSGERSEEFFKELLESEDANVREAAVRGIAGRGMNPWPWPQPRPRPFP